MKRLMTLWLLLGCGAPAEPAPATHSDGGSTTPGGGAPSGALDLLLFRPITHWVPYSDPITLETNLVLESAFELRRFFANGFVYTGTEQASVDTVRCDAASKVCATYQVSGSFITIDGQTMPLTRATTPRSPSVPTGGGSWPLKPGPSTPSCT